MLELDVDAGGDLAELEGAHHVIGVGRGLSGAAQPLEGVGTVASPPGRLGHGEGGLHVVVVVVVRLREHVESECDH